MPTQYDEQCVWRRCCERRATGQLVRSEADYQLHLIYLWYEKEPERALELTRELRARHPRNAHFWQAAAEIEDVYLLEHAGRRTEAAAAYRTAITEAERKDPPTIATDTRRSVRALSR